MTTPRPLPSEEDLQAIREGVRAACAPFGDDYWLARDDDGEFPREYHRAMADGGWLGITMPEEYGGSGLGVTEAMTMMSEVAACGGAFAASSAIHVNLFGPHPLVVHGTHEQKAQWIPRLVAGQDQVAFGFTEPDAGLNSTRIKTFAEKVPGGYRVNGQKMWTTTAQVANKILLFTRTTKFEDVAKKTQGITIFYTDLDRTKIDVHRIPKMGRKAVDSNAVFIEDLQEKIGAESGTRPVVFLCRSGNRSIGAAEAATAAGYAPAYNMLDGFEGNLDENRHRGGTGWKAVGLPWIQG